MDTKFSTEDLANMQTRAELSADGNAYRIDGLRLTKLTFEDINVSAADMISELDEDYTVVKKITRRAMQVLYQSAKRTIQRPHSPLEIFATELS